MSAVPAGDARKRLAERHRALVSPGFLARHRLAIALVLLVLYGAFSWRLFEAGETLERADWGIAGSYLADWISWESRPDIEYGEDGALAIEFPRFDPIGDTVARDGLPDWIVPAGAVGADGRRADEAPPTQITVRMDDAAVVEIGATRVLMRRGDELVGLVIRPGESVVIDGALPEWATQRRAGGKVIATFGLAGRVEIEDDEVKVRRRFLGWENFLFDARSAFHGLDAGERLALIVSGERVEPDRSNLALAWRDILHNAEWQHLDVWTKLLQTIVMAFVGTLLATLVAFPLAFLAARGIAPSRLLGGTLKRVFDFLRSVDMLIWALFFTRAFGPGPLAGIAAIFLTDTGTLGKLYAEALENVDERQREGIRATGASFTAVQRYGVVPQILPVFLGQALYFWESNTRSATIIGAVGAGGIGLKLWEAMRTNRDWENVFYMVILILVVVFVFDAVSSALRRRLMGHAPARDLPLEPRPRRRRWTGGGGTVTIDPTPERSARP